MRLTLIMFAYYQCQITRQIVQKIVAMKIQNHTSYVHKIMKSIEKNMVMNIEKSIMLDIIASFVAMFMIGFTSSSTMIVGVSQDVSITIKIAMLSVFILTMTLASWFIIENIRELKKLIKQYGENYSRLERLREFSDEDRR